MKEHVYKNKKNKNLYKILYYGVDATNSRDGEPIVIYCRSNENPAQMVFSRNKKEFDKKFTRF